VTREKTTSLRSATRKGATTTATVSTVARDRAAAALHRRSKSSAASSGMRQTAEALRVITARPTQIPASSARASPRRRTPSRISQSSSGSST